MKRFSLTIALISGLFSLFSHAQGSTVNVINPGTLRDLITELPTARINNLTITGSLNGDDISYLVGGTGKMVKVDTLDISQIDLIGNDQPYKNIQVAKSDIGFGTTTEIYYLSETDTIISDYEYTGFGGSIVTRHVYCKDLSGAFAENSSFKHVVLPQNLSRIANYIFFKNTSIESVVLPSNAKEFGNSTFESATSLKYIIIPNGIKDIPTKTFRYTLLKNVSIPPSIETIGDFAFENAPIENIDLSHVRNIGYYAFTGNRFAGTLDLSSLEQMGERAFGTSENSVQSIVLSDKLKEISDSAFSGFAISEISIPNGIISIGNYSFSDCKNLSTVEIPESVIEIYDQSFLNTPWYNNLQGEGGIIYAGAIAMGYDHNTTNPDTHLTFRDGTKIIANSSYGGFFPTYLSDWKLESVTLPSSLLRIGNSVFSSCRDLQSIELPEGLQEIGTGVFAGCTSLKNIVIPNNIKKIPNEAFYGCYNLESVTLPNGVEHIGESAFYGNINLYDCQLPTSLKRIDKWAFSKCKSLGSLTLPDKLEIVGEEAFRECSGLELVTVKSTDLRLTDIRYGIFNSYSEKNKSIYKVVISSNVRRLPQSMFLKCEGLTKLEFEDIESSSLKSIGESCFRECRNLAISQFPLSLDSIGSGSFSRTNGYIGDFDLKNIKYVGPSAFAECGGITSLTLSNPEVYLGRASFSGCENLKSVKILSDIIICDSSEGSPFYGYNDGTRSDIESVEIGATLQSLPRDMFINQYSLNTISFENRGDISSANKLAIGEMAFYCCGLNEVILPNGTIKIGKSAFALNSALIKLEIPIGCDSIGEWAFAQCYWLDTIGIGEGVSYIGESAFGGCEHLQSLVIPSTCKEIGNTCFQQCHDLNSLTLLSEVPPTFAGELGYNCWPTIYVPGKSLDLYKSIDHLEGYVILPIPGTEPEDPGDGVDNLSMNNNSITVSVSNGVVKVSGKDANIPVRIIDMNGMPIIETYDNLIDNLSSGVYIVTIEDNTFKVVI